MSKANDFGVTGAERLKEANLTIEEDEIRKFSLRESSNLGRPPRIEKIISSFNTIPTERILRALDKLEDKDIILRKKGTGEIIAAYPFSAILTPHRVTLRGKKEVYALCAVDALGMPFMFDMDGTIESSCFCCGKEIRVEILEDSLSKPPGYSCMADFHGRLLRLHSYCKMPPDKFLLL